MTMHRHVACAECMNRREFLTTAATASAGLVAIACGDGTVSGIPGETLQIPTGPVAITVGDHPELATNDNFVRVMSSIAVKRTGTASFVALSLVCTHEGCGVAITTNTQLDCPCHFSRFDGEGAVVRGPADRALGRFNTSYDPSTDVLTIG